jgi:hypothetical protein
VLTMMHRWDATQLPITCEISHGWGPIDSERAIDFLSNVL